jgi:hypothetical protein
VYSVVADDDLFDIMRSRRRHRRRRRRRHQVDDTARRFDFDIRRLNAGII